MTETSSKNLQYHLARADTYRLLSACYYEPEKAFLEEKIFDQLGQALDSLKFEPAGQAQALETCFVEAGHEDLLLDYTRLFLGPFNILAKPYGSTYLDGENVIMGESTLAVLKRYREGGFQVSEAFGEVPDHIAAELEFLYLLHAHLGNSQTRAEQREQLAELKHNFLSEHLGRWILPFTEDVSKGAETEFYRKMAELTGRLVIDDLRQAAEQSPS